MSAITAMFKSQRWRRAAAAGFTVGFVAGLLPLLVR
jgi:hypothetical protein